MTNAAEFVKTASPQERAVRRLAMLLHGEFCPEGECKGVVDFMDSARDLLPKIKDLVL